MAVSKSIKVLTRGTCAPCKQAKMYMDAFKIRYQEFTADENPELFQKAMQLTGTAMVPQFIVTTERDGETTEEGFSGYNPTKLASLR